MIFTSSYFEVKSRAYARVSISVSRPIGSDDCIEWKSVAPDWITTLKPYKEGLIDNDEYTKRYLRKLEQNHERILRELQDLLRAHGDIVLLCWCKKGNFCHRRILARWLERNGFAAVDEL